MNRAIVKVAVWLVTYNHEAFIEKSLRSVLAQKTKFSFMIFIGEDCSTDKTKEICLGYQEKYPDRIRLVCHEKNKGPAHNAKIIYDKTFKSGAKYVAMLEGDDYWTDSEKLQKQVDFMEDNPEFSSCYHRCSIVNQYNELIKKDKWKKYNDRNASDLILGRAHLITNTVLFRNVISFPPESLKLKNGDTILWHLLGFYGPAKFLADIKPSVYRIHKGGIWSLKEKYYQLESVIETYNFFVKNIKENTPRLNLQPLYLNTARMLNNFMIGQLAKGSFSNYLKGGKVCLSSKAISIGLFLRIHLQTLKSLLIKRFKK